MTAWTMDELRKIGAAEEMEVSSVRRDGRPRTPVTIWVVRLGDELYVRAVNGRTGTWFRGTQVRHEGRIWAGGVEKDVTFVDADPHLNDEVDSAYRKKYRRYAERIVSSIVTSCGTIYDTQTGAAPSIGSQSATAFDTDSRPVDY